MKRIAVIVLLLLVLLPAAALSEPAWRRLGVAIDRGPAGAEDDKGLESPVVLRVQGQLLMMYRGETTVDGLGRAMLATSSDDGATWVKQGVVMVPDGGALEVSRIDPMALLYDGATFRLFYGADGQGGVAMLATSADARAWTRSPSNPVLQKTSGTWDSAGAGGQHSVVWLAPEYRMYYKGTTSPGVTGYGYAKSTDGQGHRFQKFSQLVAGDPSQGEGTLLRNLTFLPLSGEQLIVHAIADMQDGDSLNLRLLHHTGGGVFTRRGTVFAKGQTAGGFDAKWATSPTFLVENGRVRMWYEGGSPNGVVRILYAEADLAEFMDFATGVAPPPPPTPPVAACVPRAYTALVAGADLNWGHQSYDLATGETYEAVVKDAKGVERVYSAVTDHGECVSIRVTAPRVVGPAELWVKACGAQGACRTSDRTTIPVLADCDLDDDGSCDVIDFIALLRMIRGRDPVDPRADANQDGVVNTADFNEWKRAFNAQPICSGAFGACP